MSEAYKLTGKIIVLNDTQTFASGFTKREFVVETPDEKYPQPLKFESTKVGCDKLDAFRVGDEVTVEFNIRGNEYNGKYYISLAAWKVEKTESARKMHGSDAHNESKANGYQPQRSPNQGGAPPPSQTATADELDDGSDDIPF